MLASTRSRLIPPLIAFSVQRSLLAAVAYANQFDSLASASWIRWDSVFYLDIASRGYSLPGACPPESHYPSTAWCGNTAWFSGYSWLVGALAQVPGISPAAAAVWSSAAAQLGCLIMVWLLLDDARQWPALALAAFFPGNVYMAAAFPVSLCVLAILVTMWCCWRRRYLCAAVAAAAAATCYPTGVLLGGVVAIWALLHRRWRAAWVLPGALAGFATVLLVMHLQTGIWDAFTRVQAKYSYGVNPIDTLGARLKPLVNRRYRDEKGVVTAFQTLTSAVLVLSWCYIGVHRRFSERSSLIIVYLAAFWLVPLTMGGSLSLYRSEALLMPGVLLLPTLPRVLQLVMVVATIILAIPMASLFFRGVLV
jgi:hypothetical protein